MSAYAKIYYKNKCYLSYRWDAFESFEIEDVYMNCDFTGIVDMELCSEDVYENLYLKMYRGKVLSVRNSDFSDEAYQKMKIIEENIDNNYIANERISKSELERKIIGLELEILRLKNKEI